MAKRPAKSPQTTAPEAPAGPSAVVLDVAEAGRVLAAALGRSQTFRSSDLPAMAREAAGVIRNSQAATAHARGCPRCQNLRRMRVIAIEEELETTFRNLTRALDCHGSDTTARTIVDLVKLLIKLDHESQA